jgi:hypothetical protein
MKRFALLSVVAISVTACGSSSGEQAATAQAGDSFCKLAQVAKDDNDALSNLDPTDPAKVKVQLSGAIDSLNALSAKAPKDIEATTKALLAAEEKLETLLKANDFDFVKLAASDEGKKLLDDDSISKAGDDLDKYLTDKCGIATDDSTVDTTPGDTTPGDTTPADTTAVDDTSPGISIDLGTGDDAINKFLDFYELGTGSTLSDEERACIVSNLSGKISGDDLNEAISTGQPSDAVSLALGQAFITCKVAPQS